MFKKIMVIVLLNMILIAPTAVLAEVGGATQTSSTTNIAGTVKMADATPIIRLASNDVVQTQGEGMRATANKNTISEKSATEPFQIPPQAWLALVALIYFVMRSSRRVV